MNSSLDGDFMIKVEVWSDINCPFCYIGKRHLEEAIAAFTKDTVSVEWKSFELDPNSNPPKGVPMDELLAKKYGKDIKWAREMATNITAMARDAGLDFKMDKVIPANSFHAHRLIHLAKQHGKQDVMKERLLKARFTEGLDIGDTNILKNIAQEFGLLFEIDNSFTQEVRRDEEQASELQIRGVPFFVFNQKFALSGAQPSDVFGEVLEKASAS
jgi:predicted DsbA family dithiol-disulfide isomerase